MAYQDSRQRVLPDESSLDALRCARTKIGDAHEMIVDLARGKRSRRSGVIRPDRRWTRPCECLHGPARWRELLEKLRPSDRHPLIPSSTAGHTPIRSLLDSDSPLVHWTTEQSCPGVVQYGRKPDALDREARGDVAEMHHVTLADLPERPTYYQVMDCTGRRASPTYPTHGVDPNSSDLDFVVMATAAHSGGWCTAWRIPKTPEVTTFAAERPQQDDAPQRHRTRVDWR